VSARPSLAGALLALVLVSPARGAGEVKPGAYCPFPKPGEKPACMQPAKQEYQEFFSALDSGQPVDPAALARVEAELVGSENSYLALSSLAYGYYRLSQIAAETPGNDPEIVARLERWNELLAGAYEASGHDQRYQESVREAALDLKRRSPPVALSCLTESGTRVPCDSTDAVLRDIDRLRDEVGVRGALSRLLGRFFGGEEGAR
jgi:hypothetical protein